MEIKWANVARTATFLGFHGHSTPRAKVFKLGFGDLEGPEKGVF